MGWLNFCHITIYSQKCNVLFWQSCMAFFPPKESWLVSIREIFRCIVPTVSWQTICSQSLFYSERVRGSIYSKLDSVCFYWLSLDKTQLVRYFSGPYLNSLRLMGLHSDTVSINPNVCRHHHSITIVRLPLSHCISAYHSLEWGAAKTCNSRK